MRKKCMICGRPAAYCIKGKPSDCYCEECAVEQFGDVAYLVKVEDAARQLKDVVDQLTEEGIRPQDGGSEPVDQFSEEGFDDAEEESKP